MPTLPLSKVVDANDLSSPDLAPYLREIDALTSTRLGRAEGDLGWEAMLWEQAMALRALDGAGVAASGRKIVGVGAGACALVFALARRGAIVFAVDRYLEPALPLVAPLGMLDQPENYAAAPIPRGHVLGVHSVPMRLNLLSDSFDGAFSFGLEWLGSLDDVAAAAREIGRVLRPGGAAAIGTSFRLDGPDARRSFDDRFVLFTEQMLAEYVVKPSGLTLRSPVWAQPSDATFEARHQFADFERGGGLALTLEHKRASTSDLVLYHDGFLFCPVHLTLYKDPPGVAPRGTSARARSGRASRGGPV